MTEVNEYSISGFLNIEKDFVEFPSSFIERFIDDFDLIERMSRHYLNKKRMPRSIYDNIKKQDEFHEMFDKERIVFKSFFDLYLHSNTSKSIKQNFDLSKKHSIFTAIPAWSREYCKYERIFATDHSRPYYSYLLGESMADETFNVFKNSSIICNSKLGRKFRKEIFATGSVRPAIASYKAFHGENFKKSMLSQFN